MTEPRTIKLLFVCLGNICRSPAAEAVMNSLVKRESLSEVVICDSAGTSGYHDGEEADPRMVSHAKKRDHDITSTSRKFLSPKDFEEFDYVIAMDDDNYEEILSQDRQKKFSHKIFRISQFCVTKKVKFVPDPYYQGPDSFELVLDILEDACEGLLKKIRTDHRL